MKTKSLILSALAMSTLLTVAYPTTGHAAGGGTVVDGGGGKGVVCYDSNGAIRSVESLDLYEGKIDFDYDYSANTEVDIKAIIRGAVGHLAFGEILNRSYASPGKWTMGKEGEDYEIDSVNRTIDRILETLDRKKAGTSYLGGESIKFLDNVNLNPTTDSFEVLVPKNCKVEQLAVYKDARSNEMLYVNYDLFKLMDDTNKAALILHEAIYKNFREDGEQNSIRTRRVVSRLMARKSLLNTTNDRKPGAKWLDCITDSDRMYETGKATVVRVQELNGVVEMWPLFLQGEKVLSTWSPSGSVTTIAEIKANPGSTSGWTMGFGNLERENDVMATISSNKRRQVTVHVSAKKLTSGAAPFEEDLLCYDRP